MVPIVDISTSIYPLRAVARRQGGGAVSPMVVVKCGAIVELLGVVSVTWQVCEVVRVLTL